VAFFAGAFLAVLFLAVLFLAVVFFVVAFLAGAEAFFAAPRAALVAFDGPAAAVLAVLRAD